MTQEQFEDNERKCREYILLSREKDRTVNDIKDKKKAIEESEKCIDIELQIKIKSGSYNTIYSDLLISKGILKKIMEESIKEDEQRIKEIEYKMSLI